jgi:hypothetical protein
MSLFHWAVFHVGQDVGVPGHDVVGFHLGGDGGDGTFFFEGVC